MKYFYKIRSLILLIVLGVSSFIADAQTTEWRLNNVTYSSADPDAGGPAIGSVTFTMQIHTTSGTISNVNAISTGWSYNSSDLMIPTSPGCTIVSNPANVSMAADFVTDGFSYTTVNQCSSFSQTSGSQSFNTRAVGTLDGTGIDISTTWIDVYTVTLWLVNPSGGYVIINSGAGGSPGEFTTYAVADNLANEYVANSLTFDSPLLLGPSALPVRFSNFDASCTNNGTLVSWTTASESNSDYFELQHSPDGNNWTSIATIKASGNSSAEHTYQQVDEADGTLFYRIKEVDLDGHLIYTSIIRSNCENKKMSIVTYPVPAGNLLNVVIKSDKSLKTQLLIINSTGKIVRKNQAILFNGSNTFQFNLDGLSTGNYIIRSTDPGVEFNKKFTIVR